MMRSIVWVVLLAGVVTTFSSCDKTPEPLPAIVGTWVRSEYVFTEIPSSHSYWDELTTSTLLGQETGYTIIFNADGTYSRTYPDLMNDEGTWELDGTKLTLSPDDTEDLDFMEVVGYMGPEFDVEGEISEIRMVLSAVTTFFPLCSDASIAAAGGNTANVPAEDFNGNGILDAGEDENENGVLDDEWDDIDIRIETKFNKLN